MSDISPPPHVCVTLKIHFHPVVETIEGIDRDVILGPLDAQTRRVKRMRSRYRVYRARQARSSLCLRSARAYAWAVRDGGTEERTTRDSRGNSVDRKLRPDGRVSFYDQILPVFTSVFEK